jgi:hypothetical protein
MPVAVALVLAESISTGMGALIPRPASGWLWYRRKLELSGKKAKATMRKKRADLSKAKNTPAILAHKCGAGLVSLVNVK